MRIRQSIIKGWKLDQVIHDNDLRESINQFNEYMSSIPSNDIFFVAFNNLVQSRNPKKQEIVKQMLREFESMHHNISENMFRALSQHLSQPLSVTIGTQHDGEIPNSHNTDSQSIEPLSNKLLISVLFTVVFCAAVLETIWNFCYMYYTYSEEERFEWFKTYYDEYDVTNVSVAFLIMARSLQLQLEQARKRMKYDKNNRISNTYQHFRSNVCLCFVVMFHYGLSSTVKIRALGQDDSVNVLVCLADVITTIKICLVCVHLIAGLQWGKIMDGHDTLNCMACIYLLIRYFCTLEYTATYPRFQSGLFLRSHGIIKQESGLFGEIIIMFICRPCLTIISFRCIEQIMHQILPHKHDRKKRVFSELELTEHGTNDEPHADVTYDIFTNMSALDYVVSLCIIAFILIFDLLTLKKRHDMLICQLVNGLWCAMYVGMSIWTLFIFRYFGGINHKEINLKRDLMNHLALLISLIGVVVSDVAALGIEDKQHYVMMVALLFNMVFCVSQFCLLVYLNELQLNIHKTRHKFPSYVKHFGKVIVGVNIVIIVHCFLYEAYHLEETIHPHHHKHKGWNVWTTMEFISFFWNIEFGLGCIERINFITRQNK